MQYNASAKAATPEGGWKKGRFGAGFGNTRGDVAKKTVCAVGAVEPPKMAPKWACRIIV